MSLKRQGRCLNFFFLQRKLTSSFLQINFLESNVAVIELSFPLYHFLACEHFHRDCSGHKNYFTGFCMEKKLENNAVHVLYITRSLQAERLINIQCAGGADSFRNAVWEVAFALSKNNLGEKYLYVFYYKLEMLLEN
jgi:hypothetical protein